jgi:hypothetical protein
MSGTATGTGTGTGTGTASTWAGPVLLVPVGVDALVLSQLSYNEGWSWITPNYRFAERFLSQTGLFQSDPPQLIDPSGDLGQFTGVVVRWALPDGLTYGSADPTTGAVTFPAIPNRWLVLRRVPGSPAETTAWVLASDYLGGSGTSYPAAGQATTLGMCWPLASWPGEAALPAGLDPPLTAVGPGNPTFTAYLPNVQHILAFHDPLTNVPAGQVSYTVCGWYGGGATDPLSGPQYGQAGWQTTDQWTAIMGQLGWSAGEDTGSATDAAQTWATAHGYTVNPGSPRMSLPSRTVCHGIVSGVNWVGPDGAAQPGAPTVVPGQGVAPGLILAHTSVDALATTVAASAATSGTGTTGTGTSDTAVAEALTALLGGTLPLLDEPDSGAQLAAQLQDSWFQQSPGGTRWVLAAPQGTSDQPVTTAPTAAQGQLLDALNAAQQQVDADTRQVASLQWDIYALWWKLSYVTANALNPITNAQQVITTALTAKETAATAALTALQAAVTQLGTASQAMNAQLGTLVLQAMPEPPFLRPNDPVAMVQGAGRSTAHGEDGRFTEDGGLYCRFTGQTLASLAVTGTTAPVTAGTLGLAAVTVPDAPAEVADLAVESFFLDPANAQAIAAAADPTSPQPASAVAPQLTLSWVSTGDPALGAQTSAGASGLASAYGPLALPSMVAVGYWAVPWSPLYLDWSATYYAAPYPAAGWTFPDSTTSTPLNAQTAQWTGSQLPTAGLPLQGRALLTPQAADVLAARLEQLVAQAGDDGALAPYLTGINDATAYLGTADVLSQAISGFTDLMLQRDPTQVQQPDLTTLGQWLAPPGGPAFTATTAPSAASGVPISPIRAGFLQLNELWVVDDFGQYFNVLASMAGDPQAGAAEIGPDLSPSPQAGWLVLRPRLSQASRLRLRFLDAASDSLVIGLSSAANPVCGWLIPNLTDDSLMVYDADGVLRGELLLAQEQALWLPAPDLAPPGSQTAPPDLPNPHLQALVTGVLSAANPAGALSDLMTTIQNASWAIAPSGPDAALLATLIGFPVAVVRAQLLLELDGNPATSQLWTDTGTDNDGGISQAAFPVVLGSASLDDDGVVGFFEDADPGSLSSPYGPSASRYVTTAPATVTVGQPVALTMLLHPLGTAHAFTGLLPPVTATLPSQFQTAPVHATEVTFRSGPLLTPPTAVQLPIPAFSSGDWAWLEYDASGGPALPRPLSRADSTARLPDAPPTLRDGWLRLTLSGQPTQLTYAVTPAALPTATGGSPAGSLTITAYNATSTAVTCDSITITLPTGTDPGALTASPNLIQPVSAQPSTWTFQAGSQGQQPGTFIATPVTAGSAVATGVTLGFTLASLGVSQDPGLSAVQITEVTAAGQATLTLAVERFAPGPAIPAGNP